MPRKLKNFWPFDAGQLLGSRTYHYKIGKKGRPSSRSTNSRYLGYTIYKRDDGNYTIPELTGNDGSYFEDLRQAKRFITANKGKNPGIVKVGKIHTLIIKNPDKRLFR